MNTKKWFYLIPFVILTVGTTKVRGANLFWDSDAGTTGAQDGSGTWLDANAWWDGSANATWNSSTPDNAIIGNGSTAGTITLGNVIAEKVVFTNFSGTYTLTGGSLTINSGCIVGAAANNLAVKISGATVTSQNTVCIGSNDYASAMNNSLTIENGGQLLGGGNVIVGHKCTPGGNQYNVGGAGSASYASNGTVYVAWNSLNEQLNVSNAVLNVSALRIGYSPAGNGRAITGNVARVSNQGSIIVRGTGDIYIGDHSNYNAASDKNTLLIENGGSVYAGGQLRVGNSSQKANSNKARVLNGGQLRTVGGSIGNNGISNSVHVIGSAQGTSIWNVANGNVTFKNLATFEVDGGGVAGRGIVTNIGTLTVSGTNTFLFGAGGRVYASAVTFPGILSMDIDHAVGSDCGRLIVSGNLDLTGATLNITGKERGIYVIAEYGSLTGTQAFAFTNGLPTSGEINYDYKGLKQIAIVAPAAGTLIIYK
jgi:hypothetical protein